MSGVLHEAARNCDLVGLKKEIRGGANLLKLEKGVSVLHHAIQAARRARGPGEDHVAAVRSLVEAGAHVDAVDLHGDTPLLLAARYNLTKIAKLLIWGGAAPTTPSHKMVTQVSVEEGNGSVAVIISKYFSPEKTSPTLFDSMMRGKEVSSKKLIESGIGVRCLMDNCGSTPLHEAAGEGNLGLVKLLMKHGGNPRSLNDGGAPPLQWCASKGHVEVVEFLINARACILNASDLEGDTALHRAVGNSFERVTKLLLCAGADVTKRNTKGKTALDVAREAGRSASVIVQLISLRPGPQHGVMVFFGLNRAGIAPNQILLFSLYHQEKVVLQEAIEYTDESGRTALHLAAYFESKSLVIALLSAGLDPDTRDQNGWTSLHFAAIVGNLDICTVLLKAGCRVDEVTVELETALHLAANHETAAIARVLLDAGANTTLRDSCGRNAADMAYFLRHKSVGDLIDSFNPDVKKKHHELLTLLTVKKSVNDALHLVQFKRGINYRSSAFLLFTPLHAVASDLDPLMPKLALELINAGADLEAKDSLGCTPLHLAVSSRLVSVLEVLIGAGGNVSARDYDGNTPLHAAAASNFVDSIRMLLIAGADASVINSSNEDVIGRSRNVGDGSVARFLDSFRLEEDSALIEAVKAQDVDVAKGLISRGVGVSHQGAVNRVTPLHRVVQFGLLELIEPLVAAGSQQNARDVNEETPLHWVARFDRTGSFARVLLTCGAEVNAVDCHGQTVLHLAATKNNLDVANVLLKHNVDFAVPSIDGETAKEVSLLRGNGSVSYLIDAFDRSGQSTGKGCFHCKEVKALFLFNESERQKEEGKCAECCALHDPAHSRKRCSLCSKQKDKKYFSANQWKKSGSGRKCKICLPALELNQFLSKLRMEEYFSLLAEFGVHDPKGLLDLLDSDFETLGVKKLHVRMMKDEASSIRQISDGVQVFLDRELGRGATSVVVEGMCSVRGRVAVKMVSFKYKKHVEAEVKAFRALDEHPNVLSFYNLISSGDNLCLVLSYCVMDLSQLFYNCNDDEMQVIQKKCKGSKLRLVHEVFSGLEFLHKTTGYCHRDLKPANILLDPSGTVKISDMGISKSLESASSTFAHTTIGTCGWRAPEIDASRSLKNDVFSAGLVSFFILSDGKHPFGDSPKLQERNIQDRNFNRLILPNCLENHLVEQAIQFLPENRPSLSSLLTHPVFWNSTARLRYLKHLWDENEARLKEIDGGSWKSKLPSPLLRTLRGNYDDTLADHLRCIRNIGEHAIKEKDALSHALKGVLQLESLPSIEDVAIYIFSLYPNVILTCYEMFGASV